MARVAITTPSWWFKVPPLYGRVSTTLPDPFQAIATLMPYSQAILQPRLSFLSSFYLGYTRNTLPGTLLILYGFHADYYPACTIDVLLPWWLMR